MLIPAGRTVNLRFSKSVPAFIIEILEIVLFAFFVLNFLLYVLDCVAWLHIESYSLARKGLDEDLHATAQAEHQVKGRLLLDVVVRESAAVFELLAREDQALLIRRNALLVLDLFEIACAGESGS